jgi:hypothetical protein
MRRTLVGALIAATTCLLAAGCGHGRVDPNVDAKLAGLHSGGVSPAPLGTNAPVDATPKVRGGVTEISHTTSTFITQITSIDAGGASGGATITGSLDPAAKSASVAMSLVAAGQAVDVHLTLLGGATYARLSHVPLVVDEWVQIDPAQLPEPLRTALSNGADFSGASVLAAAIVDAVQTGAATYAGHVDLSHATTSIALRLAIAGLSTTHLIAPFTAALDAAGRLIHMTISILDGTATTTVDVTFQNFGAPVHIAAPSATEITQAPPLIYTAIDTVLGLSTMGR